MVFKLGMTVDMCIAYTTKTLLMLVSRTLHDLDASSQWVGKGKVSVLNNLSGQPSKS